MPWPISEPLLLNAAHMKRTTSQAVVAPSVEVTSVREVYGRLHKVENSNGGIGGCDGI